MSPLLMENIPYTHIFFTYSVMMGLFLIVLQRYVLGCNISSLRIMGYHIFICFFSKMVLFYTWEGAIKMSAQLDEEINSNQKHSMHYSLTFILKLLVNTASWGGGGAWQDIPKRLDLNKMLKLNLAKAFFVTSIKTLLTLVTMTSFFLSNFQTWRHTNFITMQNPCQRHFCLDIMARRSRYTNSRFEGNIEKV